MDNPKSKDRIPFETLDDTSVVSAWDLPSVATNSQLVRSAKHDSEKKNARKNEKIETVKKNTKGKHLTVDELREITESARKEGFQQGLKEGTEQGIREGTKVGEKTGQQRAYMESKKEIEALQHQLRQLVSRLFDPMEKQDLAIENILVDLALNLSKRIVASEIEAEPKHVLKMVKFVISDVPKSAKNVRISMCSSDADIVEKLVPVEQRDWRIVKNDDLSSGGCIVETDSSLIDYSVDSRLKVYLEKISNSPSEPTEPAPDYQQTEQESSEVKPESAGEPDLDDD